MNNKYLYATLFLAVLILGTAIYFSKNNSRVSSQVYSTPNTSATIEPSVTPATGSAQTKMEDKLIIKDEKVGTGEEAVSGKKITVNYLGTFTDGAKFDSSYDRNEPFSFTLGAGEVIQGWDQGFAGMKVGGKRKLTIPSSLGYGPQGIPGAIPGGATLIFEVELLKVE